MNRAQLDCTMSPLYGVCYYAIVTAYGMFFRGEVDGVEYLPRRGPVIIASNHASHLDPPFVGCQLPRQLSFFARKTLWKPGLASWWLNGVGTIPVDRDGGTDVPAIKRVLQALREDKALIVFPEGTRSPDGRLQPPKFGVGLIACRADVPVVPARIFDSHRALGKDGRLRLGTPLPVVFGPPLYPRDYDDPSAGKERYQIASERIMAAIAKLQRPVETVV